LNNLIGIFAKVFRHIYLTPSEPRSKSMKPLYLDHLIDQTNVTIRPLGRKKHA